MSPAVSAGRVEFFVSPTRTFSTTKPWTKRRRIRENSSSRPCLWNEATRRALKKSGRPTRLNQASDSSAASTTDQTAKRSQRSVVRHLRQKPSISSRVLLGNRQIRGDERTERGRKFKDPALAIQRHGGIHRLPAGHNSSEIHGPFFAVFQFHQQVEIVCVQPEGFRRGKIPTGPGDGVKLAEPAHRLLSGERID